MTSRTIHIRRAVVSDAAAFARILGHPDVVPGTLQQPHSSEGLWLARLGDALALGKPDVMLVAELPDGRGQPQVVGTAGLHPVSAALRRRHAMNLGVAVHPDAQRQGVGSWVMTQVLFEADRLGLAVRLTALQLSGANRFYEHHHGFELQHTGEWDLHDLRTARGTADDRQH